MTTGFSFAVVLFGHILSDFYIQTTRVAQQKLIKKRAMALHCGLYALSMLPFCCVAIGNLGPGCLLTWAIIAISHAMVDALRCAYHRNGDLKFWALLIDQVLHCLFCFIALAVGFHFFESHALPSSCLAEVLPFSLALALMWRPGSIFIESFLEHVRNDSEGQNSTEGGPLYENLPKENSPRTTLRAGRWIGILERTIVSTLTLLGQFEAIAFVLAAKSIARFKKLDDEDFAESYLVGTLMSTAYAIVVTLLVAWLCATT